eukprot:SAG31_NODE_2477_length_5637_cov_10.057241_9_plen_148_part_00
MLKDPFVTGEGGLGHGIELQRGPHRGRFVLPYAQASTSRDKYAAHALTVYSDTHGATWTAGALLPDYSGEAFLFTYYQVFTYYITHLLTYLFNCSGEAAITELANGSVLISFRMEGEHMAHHPHNRGFARSVRTRTCSPRPLHGALI